MGLRHGPQTEGRRPRDVERDGAGGLPGCCGPRERVSCELARRAHGPASQNPHRARPCAGCGWKDGPVLSTKCRELLTAAARLSAVAVTHRTHLPSVAESVGSVVSTWRMSGRCGAGRT